LKRSSFLHESLDLFFLIFDVGNITHEEISHRIIENELEHVIDEILGRIVGLKHGEVSEGNQNVDRSDARSSSSNRQILTEQKCACR